MFKRFMKFIEQYNCDHVYKSVKYECLTQNEIFYNYIFRKYYKKYAVTKECVKCGLINIVEENMSE